MGEVIGVLDNIPLNEHTNVNPQNLYGNTCALVLIQHPMGHEIELEQGPFLEPPIATVLSTRRHWIQ